MAEKKPKPRRPTARELITGRVDGPRVRPSMRAATPEEIEADRQDVNQGLEPGTIKVDPYAPPPRDPSWYLNATAARDARQRAGAPTTPQPPRMRAATWQEQLADRVRDLYESAAGSLPGLATDALGMTDLRGIARGFSEVPQAGQVTGTALPTPPVGPLGGVPGFFSRLEEFLLGLPSKSVHPNTLKNELERAISREALNRDELIYRRVPDFLARQGQRPMSPRDLLGHLDQPEHSLPNVVAKNYTGYQPWSDYQLPGGQNYQVRLLTLPENRLAPTSPFMETNHYDDPNVLVATRFNERGDLDLGPGRFLEEAQGDWHQRGAGRLGYQAQPGTPARAALEAKIAAARQELNARYPAYEQAYNRYRDTPWSAIESPQLRDAYEAAEVRYNEARDLVAELERRLTSGVPPAPFKGDAWLDLGLKQQLLDIAHNRPDLNWFGYTGGATQHKRWAESPRAAWLVPHYEQKMAERVRRILQPHNENLGSAAQVERFGLQVPQPGRYEYGVPAYEVNHWPPEGGRDALATFFTRDEADAFLAQQRQRLGPAADLDVYANYVDRRRPPTVKEEPSWRLRLSPDLMRSIREKGFGLLGVPLAAGAAASQARGLLGQGAPEDSTSPLRLLPSH